MEVKRMPFFAFYAQYIRKKKINILLGSILAASLILLVQTSSKFRYIQNDLNEMSQDRDLNKEGNIRGIKFKLEYCNCTRTILPGELNVHSGTDGEKTTKDILFNETTCSKDSFMRGSGQKVVGFSFYGDINTPKNKKKGYFEGIVGNLELMSTYYPGWIMRLYYDLDDNDPITEELCNLACKNPILDICNARRLPGTPQEDASRIFPMNWRFFPTLDPQVDIFASRDLDSRINAREMAAVREWRENSTQPIHAMRDHPNHSTSLLGASWDTDLTRRNAREKWKKVWIKMLRDPLAYRGRHEKGPDQLILHEYVWKRFGKRMSMQHDAYLCKKWPHSIGWPTQRVMEPNNFVASIAKDNHTFVHKCPITCRRKVEWEYC